MNTILHYTTRMRVRQDWNNIELAALYNWLRCPQFADQKERSLFVTRKCKKLLYH